MNETDNIGEHADIKMRLLGIIHGDGNMSGNRLLITDMSEEFHTSVLLPMVEKAFGIKMNIFHDINRNSYYSHTKRKAVYEFFTNNLEVPRGAIREQLFVPEFVKNADFALQAEYVGGLYDAEGCLKSRQAEINFSTTSKDVHEFVKHVLSRAQIKFSVYIRKRHVKAEYEIYIYGKDNLKKFNELIKFTHPRKIRELSRHITIH